MNDTKESLRKIGGYQHYISNIDDMPFISYEVWFPVIIEFNFRLFRNFLFVIKESLIEDEIFSEETE